MIDKIILKDLKINFEKLLGLGFIKKDNYYEYETKIIDNQFSLIIKIDKDNSICSDVIDLSTNEKFILYDVTNATGEYIGKIREEYNKKAILIIDSIRSHLGLHIMLCVVFLILGIFFITYLDYLQKKKQKRIVNEQIVK